MKKILVVCAHPDDETLGLGGTLALHSMKKEKTFVLIFTDGESARGKNRKKIVNRKQHAKKACSILGIQKLKFLNYSDQKLDAVPLIDISRKIESVIKQWKPHTVYTHYWGDVNQDHRRIFDATLIAVRQTPSSSVKHVICFETPGSTEWGKITSKFSPNLFIDIEKVINKKLNAFLEYKSEVMNYPHPRSKEGVLNRAKYWGNCVGIKFAEPFVSIREIKK